MNLTIRIPGRIDPDLSPNARVHHMRRYRAVKEARRATYYAAVSLFTRGEDDGGGVRFRYDVTVGLAKGEKTKDSDNIVSMLKAAIDGIADGLGMRNDRGLRLGTVEQVRDPEGIGFVEFVLTDITSEAAA